MTIKVHVRNWGRKFWYMTWLDPVTGKWVTQSTKKKSRREADDVRRLKEIELNAVDATGDGLMSWSDFVDAYDEEHLEDLAANSRTRALGVLEIFGRQVQPQNLRVITGQVIGTHLKWLRAHGRGPETVKLHRRTLRAALRWAVDEGHLTSVPNIPKSKRARQVESKAKGRPLTTTEFVKMLRATKSVVGAKAAKSVRRLLRGLWLSGLRLDESISLGWTPDHDLWIETESGEYPLLGIKSAGEKGGKNRLLPLTKDFAEWVLRTPPTARFGRVFSVEKQRYQDVLNENYLSKLISAIGEAAGIVVAETGKFASAHDLRRSFGLRWAMKGISVFELQQLMRHSDIKTTQQYYVTINAQEFAAKLWNQK